MPGQLLRLSLLLTSLTCSSSVDPTNGYFETNITENVPILTANDPSFAALNENTTNNKVATFNETSTATGGATPEETSTLTVDVSTNRSITGKAFTPTPVSGLITNSTDLPLTSHKGNKTKDYKMTPSSDPSGATRGITKFVPTQSPKSNMTPSKGLKDIYKLILIGVCIVILILILVTVLIFMVRSKRRRGSQSFSTRSRSSKRQDAWAGQVPELGDGMVTTHPVGMENGKAGNKAEPAKEQEMITFISGEKKDDSVVELNELGKGDALDEKPLLEETSPMNEEDSEEEKIPAPTMEQELV